MLLKGYHKEIINAECNPNFESVHCIAHLHEDISEVIPYLNAELGGHQFISEPISVTFKIYGRLITVHSNKIAVNALKDETQADKILEWLKDKINESWENRHEIKPLHEAMPRPKLVEILKLLPNTNCKECGQPTCMVFALQLAEGEKGVKDCSQLIVGNREKLEKYIRKFIKD